MNIAFAGWWTGWHVFPIKSIINYIKNNEEFSSKFENIVWFGEDDSLEQKIANEIYEIEFVPMISGKLRRERSPLAIAKNIIDIFKFSYGIWKAIWLIKKNKIDIIFCKWWYVALPVVIAGWMMRKKIFVHESDTIAWLTNRLANKFATQSFEWFPESLTWARHVWQILSEDILEWWNVEMEQCGNDLIPSSNISTHNKGPSLTNKTNILLIWWSQWATTIYQSILDIIKNNPEINDFFNFFVILWTANINMKKEFDKYENIKTYEFINQKEIGELYNICDIWITRGWATSLAEQKFFDMKLIIIPLPYTGWNHQYHNAKYYEEKFWDMLIPQWKNLSNNLLSELENLKWFKKEKKETIEKDINNNIKKMLEEMFK